jgi:hypothetical protein
MHTNFDTVIGDFQLAPTKKKQILPHTSTVTYKNRASLPFIDGIILAGLALVALLPRVILAHELDLVTDEIIYIMAGKTYFPLLLHLHIRSNQWAFNYEHPPLVKLLIGLSLFLNAHMGSIVSELFAARMPSILCGTALIVAVYLLGRAPFGRVIALLAALCLAVSPWLVYFSALAYLDMTMTMLVTLAYLLLWPAIRQPRLYLLSGLLVGLGMASKYTAILVLPSIIFFTAYYFIVIRSRLDTEQRPPVPWKWWVMALLLIPVAFFIADPAIWRQPYSLFIKSILFEWHQSITGHLTFLAGQYGGHVFHWAVLYIIFAKLSIFVTAPALFFLIYAFIQLLRFHLKKTQLQITEITAIAFLGSWLVSLVSMFSLLTIVVGTHYFLPLAAPIALAGAFGITILVRCSFKTLLQNSPVTAEDWNSQKREAVISAKQPIHVRSTVMLALLFVFFVGPHLIGLMTVYAEEGYSSELFNGEDSVLQVAYPGYREAALWLIAHTHTAGRVGIVAFPETLIHGDYYTSWYRYNSDIKGKLTYSEVQPTRASFSFDYLIWPMHLIQRGYIIPKAWRSHVVHMIIGGHTIYCFILAKKLATLT